MNTRTQTVLTSPSANTYTDQKKLRIVINGRFLTQGITGVQRYALELVKALDGLLHSGEIDSLHCKVEIIAPQGARDPSLNHIVFRQAGFFKGQLWEQFELPLLTRNALLINLCNTAPVAKRNQFITIHDTAVWAVPQAYSFAYRAWYRLLLPSIAKMAKHVFTVSQFSKKELIRWLGVPEKKCYVLKEGKEHIESVIPDDSIIAKHQLVGKPFVLAVSSLSPNKNFRAIVQALEWLGDAQFDLVIAGGTNPRVFANEKQKMPDFVKHVGYVSDAELKSLYENASCFVYPSLYEGFGLPPLEAMTCGCPVIVSEKASLPEVCGDAALYCDPLDPQSIATQIKKIMSQPDLRSDLSLRGLKQAEKFSWSQCAREVWKEIMI